MPIRPENRARYSRHWKLISKLVRFKLAGNCCEWCYAPNGQPHPETGSKVVLTVAHLDHRPENNIRENLRALCQKCHNGHDAAHRRAGRVLRETGQPDMLERA